MTNSPTTATPPGKLIRPLTSIRFFAASGVVLFHSGASYVSANRSIPAWIGTLLLNGYLGVTFFFVLSGFILQITYRGNLNLGKFWIARFARIYPVYLLAVLAMLPFVEFAGLRDLPQFFLIHRWRPNDVGGWSNWNMPSWTLSVEFFFYLCFPALSALAQRTDRIALWATIIAIIVFDAITTSSSLSDVRGAPFAWMRYVPLPALRLPEFVLGICAAELHVRQADWSFPFPSWLPAIILGGALCLSAASGLAVLATAMSAILIAAVASDRDSRFVRFLAAAPLVLLGGASYSLYLLHQPVHFAVAALVGHSKLLLAIQYPVLIGVSLLVFTFYEETMRERIRSWFGRRPSVISEIV